MRILVVEDEEKLADSLKRGLEKNGYAVDCLFDGEAGQRRIEVSHDNYDLVILDLMLPKRNGFEVCRAIRARGLTIPILILTARDMTGDKVAALDSGADDYLTKPFSFEEFLARIRALLRRPSTALGSELRVGELVLKPAEHELYVRGTKIELTLKEFELLHLLMRHVGEVMDRENIYVHLWDFADNSMSNTIDVHMKNLRRKMDDSDHEKFIEAIRGVGYRLKKSN